ncbi:14861_t:CDS:1 [Acaulospora morrowiae]|uniref:14861_t:CDS:1 n=1 Tax=Acaulospora morrowiae TaxID=94023 RepID=A0A9N9GAE9_9GLOM|nr:14861_t:CDS:1 [Acaulospora morrowiae]
MIFYCGKVILFAFLIALTLTAAQDDSFDEGESAEIEKSTNSTTTSLAEESQNPISEAVIGIVVGAVGIAVSAALFYYLCMRKKKDKASTDDGGDETNRDLPPTVLTNPLIDLRPKDNIIKGGIGEVSAEDPGVGPESTIIELPEGTETSRKGEREQIIVTEHGAAKNIDPSKLDIPPHEIHGTHHISSSSVDLSQGQGPSGNDFE